MSYLKFELLIKKVRHFYSQISPDIDETIMDLMGLPFPASLSDVKKKAEKKLCQKVVIYRTMPIPIREKWNLVPVLCWPLVCG